MRGVLRLSSFAGRASRREFAWVFLATLGLDLVHLAVIVVWPGVTHQLVPGFVSLGASGLLGWVTIAVSVRRLHDLGKTGWLLVLYVIPIVGVIILVWLFGRLGTPGPNRFGSVTTSGADPGRDGGTTT